MISDDNLTSENEQIIVPWISQSRHMLIYDHSIHLKFRQWTDSNVKNRGCDCVQWMVRNLTIANLFPHTEYIVWGLVLIT